MKAQADQPQYDIWKLFQIAIAMKVSAILRDFEIALSVNPLLHLH